MLRVYLQIFNKLYPFANISRYYIYIYIYIYIFNRPSIISLASKLKTLLANGDSIAKVSVEGCCVLTKRLLDLIFWAVKSTQSKCWRLHVEFSLSDSSCHSPSPIEP